MADSFIIIDEPAVTDKKLDTEQVVVGANTVERERFIIAGLGATDFIRPVAHDAPSAGNPMPIGGFAKASAPADVSADGDRVNAWFDLAGRLAIHDGAGSITVDGTVAVTNAGTFVVQENGAALTSLQLIDDVVYVDDTATHATGTSKGVLLMAAATPTDAAVDANDIGALAMTLARELKVSLTTALPAGTNGIGKLTANSGVTIGAVEIAAAQTLATVTTVSTVTAVTTLTGGGVADASADSGNPVKIGGKVLVTPKGMTLLADANRGNLSLDSDSALRVKGWTTGQDLISTSQSVTDTTSTALTNFGAVASTKNFVTAVTVHNAHATTNGFVKLQDGSGGTTLWVFPAPATGGATHNFDPPLKQPTANTALYFASSASITTIYISVNGFQSKAY